METAANVSERVVTGPMDGVTPEAALDAIHRVMGRHPGFRAAHARGTVCRGVFIPTEAASRLTTAPHMQDQPVPVLVRFSNASGDPAMADGAPDARGMATRFYPDAADPTDIVAVTLPCFFAPDPAAFMRFNRAFRRLGPGRRPLPRPIRLLGYLRDHYHARSGILHALWGVRVPSYGNCRYNALHTFKWIDAHGNATFVRYSWLPDEGERKMSWATARKQTGDFLQRDLVDRLGRDPVRPIRFTLELQIASGREIAARVLCDSTVAWSDACEKVQAGLLEVTALDYPEGAAGPPPQDEAERLTKAEPDAVARRRISQRKPTLEPFNPLKLIEGIEAPAPLGENPPHGCDRILAFRPPVYRLSYDERTSREQS